MERKTVLMMSDGDTSFNGFCALYSLLSRGGKYRLIIICEKVNNVEQILRRYSLNKDNMEILYYDGNTLEKYVSRRVLEIDAEPQIIKPNRKWTGRIKAFYEKNNRDIHYSMGYLLWQMKKEIKRLRREDKIAKQAFLQYSPDILLLYTDRNIGLVQSLIYEAKRNSIPRVIAPVTRAATVRNLMNMRYGKKECEIDESIFNSKNLMEKLNSDWVYEYKNKKYIFYQPWIALSGWILKRISLKPWAVGGGEATMVALQSEEDYKELVNIYRDEKIESKYILTKGVEESLVWQSYFNRNTLKSIICRKYRIDREKIYIFAAPQLYEHKMVTWEVCKYNIIKIIESLLHQNIAILVSLHPKMERRRYQFIEDMDNVRIVDEALSGIIGIADAFICLDECSTRSWAQLVNIDIISIETCNFCNKMSEQVINEHLKIKRCTRQTFNEKEKKDFIDILEDIL